MNNTNTYYSPKQGRLPVFISGFLEISDPVITFDHIMEEIGIAKYLKMKLSIILDTFSSNKFQAAMLRLS